MTVKPANYKYLRSEGTSLKEIGPVYADIELLNFEDAALNRRGYLPEANIRGVRIKALVNSDAFDLIISPEMKERLDLRIIEERTMEQAEIVGPVEVRFETQIAIVRAMVLPNTEEVLLGRFPRAGLHTFIDPEKKRLLVMPYIPIKKIA
ncbi:MAG TPA: hypothetical protein VKB05_11410 [Pyrinomonadaceae bacterium]|nr:hypothetical protein [Pyrinomonadaceae bacterium]